MVWPVRDHTFVYIGKNNSLLQKKSNSCVHRLFVCGGSLTSGQLSRLPKGKSFELLVFSLF